MQIADVVNREALIITRNVEWCVPRPLLRVQGLGLLQLDQPVVLEECVVRPSTRALNPNRSSSIQMGGRPHARPATKEARGLCFGFAVSRAAFGCCLPGLADFFAAFASAYIPTL